MKTVWRILTENLSRCCAAIYWVGRGGEGGQSPMTCPFPPLFPKANQLLGSGFSCCCRPHKKFVARGILGGICIFNSWCLWISMSCTLMSQQYSCHSKLACCQAPWRFSDRFASNETHWNSFAAGFCWGDTSGTTSKQIFVFSGPLFLLHLESMGYPFLQVRRTAVANVVNSLILIFISEAPVTLAPCHGLSKLKQCCSFPSAWRTTSCFPTIYGS